MLVWQDGSDTLEGHAKPVLLAARAKFVFEMVAACLVELQLNTVAVVPCKASPPTQTGGSVAARRPSLESLRDLIELAIAEGQVIRDVD